MIHASYTDGRTYHAATLDDVDFKEFTCGGLKSLRVASFVWHEDEHGTPQYHGLRTCKTAEGAVLWRIYIMVTDRWKIFVFSHGDTKILPDWIIGTQFFDRFAPTAATLPVAGGP